MTHRRIVLTAGFAMFSMFFGSGNLVFPLLIGKTTLHQYPWATLGLLVTAVIVPFLGLIGIIFYQGRTKEYFASLGRFPSFLIILMMLSLMGPFGVVPRCITVAYGSVNVMVPQLSFFWFCFAFCSTIMVLIWRSNKVVDVIGLLLTPFKLGGLLLLMLVGLWYGQPVAQGSVTKIAAITDGLMLGYQTMDLMAAFFFSSTIVIYLRQNLKTPDEQQHLTRLCLQAVLIGAAVLSLSYVGFVALGAYHAGDLGDVKPEALLATIALNSLGGKALPLISLTMAVACLATAVILTNLFVDFVYEEIFQKKLPRNSATVATIVTTFAMSLLGFETICQWLGTILEVAYPALIALAISNLINYAFTTKQIKLPFWIALFASGLFKISRFVW